MPFGGQNSNGGQRRKKIAIIGTSALILVAMVVAVAVGFNRSESDSQSAAPTSPPPSVSTTTKAIQAICQPTDYRETCENSLTSAAGNTSDPKELIKAAFNVAIDHISAAIKNSSTLKELAKDSRTNQALSNCDELLNYAIDDLKESFDRIGPFEYGKLDEYVDDLKIWLSGAITYEQTCLDGFENTTGEAGERMKAMLRSSQELTSNGLAMVTEISSILTSYNLPFNVSRRLLSSEDGDDTTPSWLSHGKRRLLQATGKTIKADVVVAKDGSGKYGTVNEALKDIPKKGNKTFVIYIKQGVYKEQVMFDKSMTHVMIIGDGPTKTRITGSLNFIDGVQTFKTATVSAIGSNFIAKDIGFENSAGPQKHQAVALRVQSDMSIFYNCRGRIPRHPLRPHPPPILPRLRHHRHHRLHLRRLRGCLPKLQDGDPQTAGQPKLHCHRAGPHRKARGDRPRPPELHHHRRPGLPPRQGPEQGVLGETLEGILENDHHEFPH